MDFNVRIKGMYMVWHYVLRQFICHGQVITTMDQLNINWFSLVLIGY